MNETSIKRKRYSLALIIFTCIMVLGILLFIYRTIFGIGDMFNSRGDIGFKYTAKKHYEFNIEPKKNTYLVTDMANTDINVERSSDEKVHIIADIKIKSSKLKKIPSDFITVNKNNGIEVEEKRLDSSDLGFNQSNDNTMTIKVPDGVFKKLHLNTDNADISVTDVKTLLDMNSENGDLIVKGCSSNIEGSTNNGDINVDFDVDSVKKVKLITSNGDVDIRGLAFKNANFDFKTINGEVSIPSKFSHLIDHDNNNVLRVKRGNGKNSYKAHSTNGDINFEN